jgi:hypothetical protein
MIGQEVLTASAVNLYATRPNIDFKRADYAFYDRLRRNKAVGYELGGALAERVCRIMQSFTFGKGVTLTLDGPPGRKADYINSQLAKFIEMHSQTLAEWYYDGLSLGDGFLAVNPNGDLRQISPEQVTLKHDPLDYRQVLEAVIQTNILFDSRTSAITDTYSPSGRTLKTQVGTEAAVTTSFPNLIGQLPILHYPHGRSSNEIYGHPAIEGLLYPFARYDNVIQKSLDGVERMGNAIPVAEGLEDPETERDANATGSSQHYLSNGDEVTVKEIDFSEVQMLWLGKGGSFKFASPPPFTGDATAMLQMLFYIMAERTGIIEGVWGTAMNSSHASLDAQLPAFDITILGWQLAFTPFLKQAASVWLAWQGLTDPRLRLPTGTDLKVTWGRWLQPDATLLFAKVKYAEEANLLARAEALRGLDLPFVKDPVQATQQAEEEAEARNPFNQTENDISRLAEDNPDGQADLNPSEQQQ